MSNTALVATLAGIKKMGPQIAASLPPHVDPDRWMRLAQTAVQNEPYLLECDRKSLYRSLLTAAGAGLELDKTLGTAYLVPFKGEVTLIPGYQGLLHLVRQSGELASIEAHPVYENDFFEFEYGSRKRLVHRPEFKDRGEIVAFYAHAMLKSGEEVFEVMPREDVDAIKASALAGKKNPQYSPWSLHYPEMGRKTALRRLCKFLPKSVMQLVGRALEVDNEQFEQPTATVVETPDEPQGSALDAFAGTEDEEDVVEIEGEVVDDDEPEPEKGDEEVDPDEPLTDSQLGYLKRRAKQLGLSEEVLGALAREATESPQGVEALRWRHYKPILEAVGQKGKEIVEAARK